VWRVAVTGSISRDESRLDSARPTGRAAPVKGRCAGSIGLCVHTGHKRAARLINDVTTRSHGCGRRHDHTPLRSDQSTLDAFTTLPHETHTVLLYMTNTRPSSLTSTLTRCSRSSVCPLLVHFLPSAASESYL